ncbi:MAG: TonB-dependent receptor [Magnetococcales bacterium]|nr:TonB-dependent receptor [Magnetococcales bacterium]
MLAGHEHGALDLMPKRSVTGDTATLLGELPGVALRGNGGVSSLPEIHGLADDRLRTQVDGVDAVSACANHMNPPLSYIDPTHVGSVRVFPGVTPVSVGGDSIGGTIQVESPAPRFAKAGESLFTGEAGTHYRSNGDALGAHLTATAAGESLSATYSGAVAKAGDYTAAKAFKPAALAASDRGWLNGDEVGSSRHKAENHALGLAARHENHLTELKIDAQEIPYQGFPNQRMDMTENDNLRGQLHYTGRYAWGVLEGRIHGEHTRHRMDFGPDKQFTYGTAATILAPGMPMNTDGKTLGAQLKADVLLSERDTLRVGAEALRYRLDDWWPPSPAVLPAGVTTGGMAPNTFLNINNGQRDRVGVFAEWEARWQPQWTSLLGVRGELVRMDTDPVHGYNNGAMYGDPAVATSIPGAFNAADRRRDDGNVDLTALARYTPTPDHTFEAGYARKTRSPNLYERYAWSTNTMAMEMVNLVGDGNYYLGNLDLKPEVAHTFSATADWHDGARGRWGLRVTPYVTHVEDYIDARRCPTAVCGASTAVTNSLTATSGFVYLQYVNQSARLYGMDVEGHAQLVDGGDYGRLTLKGSAGDVRGENRTTGDHLYDIMPLHGKLAVVHQRERWSNTVEEVLVAPKREVSQTRDELKTGGYGLLNLRSSYEWDRARLDVGLDNVLNQFYNPPLAGAYVGQGATMSGGAIPWGTPIPGPGRAVYAGLTVKF